MNQARWTRRPSDSDKGLVAKIVATMTAGAALVVGGLFLDGWIEAGEPAPQTDGPSLVDMAGGAAPGDEASNASPVHADD